MKIIKHLSHYPLIHLFHSSLVRGASAIFLMQLASRLLGVSKGFVLARSVGAAGLGIINYTSSIITLFIIFANLGFQGLIVREVAVAESTSRPDEAHGLLRFASIISVMMSIVIIVLIIVLSLPTVSLLEIPTTTTQQHLVDYIWIVWVLAVLPLPLQILTGINQSALRGVGKIVQSHITGLLISPASYLVMIIIAWVVWGSQLSIFVVMLLQIAVVVITYFSSKYFFKKEMPLSIRQATPVYTPSVWLKAAFPFMLIGGMHVINNRTDVIMLGMYDSIESVGIYVMASQFANYVIFPVTAANSTIAPRFASLFAQHKTEQLQTLFTQTARMVFLVTLGLAAIIVFAGQFILGIYGQEFVAGYPTLVIIVVGQLFSVSVGSIMILLTMTNYSSLVAIGVGVSTIINIIFNFILIPQYGIEGAALASAASTIIWNIIIMIFVWRKLKIVPTFIGKFW